MSFSTLFDSFAGNVHQNELRLFEAASDELAIQTAQNIANEEHNMSGDYKLEEYREIGTYPKPKRVAA